MTPGFFSQAVAHDISLSTTLFFASFLVLMVLALAFEEKLHCKKSLITGVTAVITLPLAGYFGLLPFGPLEDVLHHQVTLPVYIPGVDWEVICIIVGSGIFVDVISRSGLFTWIAVSLTIRSSGDPYRLLWYYGILTVLFSAFLNNVTAIIIIGSLTVVSMEKLNKRELLPGFLLVEGLLTNVGGLLTLISSVPNIIAGNAAGISFISFLFYSSPYVVVTTVVTILMGAKFFNIQKLSSPEDRETALAVVSEFDPSDGVQSKKSFYSSVMALTLLIIFFATASALPLLDKLGLGYVAMAFAIISLLAFKSRVQEFYAAIDWDLIGFFICLFIVIYVMEHAAVLALIGKGIGMLLSLGDTGGMFSLLWGASIVSSVTDNIPLTAVLARVLQNLSEVPPSDSPLWWAVIFGANLGGNITPIGSASTLVAVAIMHRHKIPMSFMEFVKKAVPFAFVQLIMASIYLFVLSLF